MNSMALVPAVNYCCGSACSLSASAKSSPVRQLNSDNDSSQSPGTSPAADTDRRAALSPTHTSPSTSSLVANR